MPTKEPEPEQHVKKALAIHNVTSTAGTTRANQGIWTPPRHKIKPTKKEIYNTEAMRSIEQKDLPTYKIKQQQQGR